jgi:hypothetical protein
MLNCRPTEIAKNCSVRLVNLLKSTRTFLTAARSDLAVPVKYPAQIVFFLALTAVGLSVYGDYGIAWDEPAQRTMGAATLKYIDERLAPAGHFEFPNDYDEYRDHGIAFEAPAVALEVMLGIKDERDVFMFRHLLVFLVSLAGIYAVYRMAERRFSDWRVGLLAALFLVLTPRIFAESFYNSKDIVFMAVFSIAMNTMIGFVLKPSVKTALLHALASAVAIDVRIMGVILPLATVGILIIKLMKKELFAPVACRAVATYLPSALVLVLAMWPWLWSDPIGNFVHAFKSFARYGWEHEVLYMGRFVPSTELPWHYVAVWISITTPLLYLALFVIGAFNTLHRIVSRGTRLWKGDEELQDAVFLGLFAVPIIALIVLHSVLYDGWRHLYFIYPAFLLLAIKGWISVWQNDFFWPIRKPLLAIATSISIVHTAVWMWKVHPYQNLYFNALAGTDLRSQYELDYWGLANRKALEYILRHDQSEVVYVRADSWTPLWVAFNIIDARDRKRLRYSDDQNLCRYVVTNYRRVKNPDDAKYAKDYEPFYQIQVDGETILSVFRRRGK